MPLSPEGEMIVLLRQLVVELRALAELLKPRPRGRPKKDAQDSSRKISPDIHGSNLRQS
jgi:hypothetical protein